LEIARELGAALTAPPSADSAAKAKFKFAESRRKKNKEKRKNFTCPPLAERTFI